MIKKLFLFLLKKYTKTEEQRLEVFKVLQEQVSNTYSEQSGVGQIYAAHTEFIISNEVICKCVKNGDEQNLTMIASGLNKAYERSLEFILNEKC